MAEVMCPYCGESYPQNEKKCPLCGADNENYAPADVSAASSSVNIVDCECCGERYDITLDKCPLCSMDNPYYGSASSNTDLQSTATLIEEDGVYEPVRKPQNKKQDAPDKYLVLASFIGVIVLIIIIIIKGFIGVSSSASEKIGYEIFNTQESDYR